MHLSTIRLQVCNYALHNPCYGLCMLGRVWHHKSALLCRGRRRWTQQAVKVWLVIEWAYVPDHRVRFLGIFSCLNTRLHLWQSRSRLQQELTKSRCCSATLLSDTMCSIWLCWLFNMWGLYCSAPLTGGSTNGCYYETLPPLREEKISLSQI